MRDGTLKVSSAAPFILRLARIPSFRARAMNLAFRMEGGQMFSATARTIMTECFDVSIGAYSYGACFDIGAFPSGTRIGRYVSLAEGIRAFPRNHPLDRRSTHPFFYNAALGLVPEDNIASTALIIGHDAWIGYRAIITPSCARIGIGSVIGAGSVVTKDVPDFAIVAGNPAKLIRMRFSPELCRAALESRWWEMDFAECRRNLPVFTTTFDATEDDR